VWINANFFEAGADCVEGIVGIIESLGDEMS